MLYFGVTALGTVIDLVNSIDQVKVPKIKVRYRTDMILQHSKVRHAPMMYIKTQLESVIHDHGDQQ